MRTKRMLGLVALIAGCAQTGSTAVRLAPPGNGEIAWYELRGSDGAPVGRLAIEAGGAIHEGPGRDVIHAGLTLENTTTTPLAVEQLVLTGVTSEPIVPAELDGTTPATIVVMPGEKRTVDVAFLPPVKIDQIRSAQLHWTVWCDGAPLAENVTVLTALESSRTYANRANVNAVTPDDQHLREDFSRNFDVQNHRMQSRASREPGRVF